MEGKIVEAIYHVKSINKKKPSKQTYKNLVKYVKIHSFQHFVIYILSYIRKSTASNIDFQTVSDMVTKSIIDKDFRILNESSNPFTLPQISDDDVEFLYLENGSEALQKLAHESIDNLETTRLASLQSTPNLPSSIAKFNAI